MLALADRSGGGGEARFLAVTGTGAWRRCAFRDLALVGETVQLAWNDQPDAASGAPPDDPAGAGLAFDSGCRLLHSLPDHGQIERVLWGAFDPLHPGRGLEAVPVIGAAEPAPSGDFAPLSPLPAAFRPRALACDPDDRLYVLDTLAAMVRVFDLPDRRLLRSVPVPARPVDIAWHDGHLYGLSAHPPRLWRMSALQTLRLVGRGLEALADPSRLAFAEDGRCFVLDAAHDPAARVFELGRPGRWRATPVPLTVGGAANAFARATDLVCVGQGDEEGLVVARRPGETFARVDIAQAPYSLSEPLTARAYDGQGIAATPDGRVAFWTAKGVRHAVRARTRYRPSGRVVSFRLDGGAYRTLWGRVLLDACIPSGAAIRVASIVSDDDDAPFQYASDRLPRTPPAFSNLAPIAEAETTPLPPKILAPADDERGPPVFRRVDGGEQPWITTSDDFATYEAQPPAARGRYLWLVFDLTGTSTATPKLRDVRVERPGHDWLARLPALYGRDERMRVFLQRYLAPEAGLIEDTAAQSDSRNALLKAESAPVSVLPWLAGWLGLVLDERWSETARRTMIREAPALFRARGTPAALRRMVEIVAEAPAVILEDFRLRGFRRGAGAEPGWNAPSVLGGGFRVGGPVGEASVTVTGTPAEVASIFEGTAHRFSILIQAALDSERLAAIGDLLEVHRPAHTLVEVCTGAAGMRLGRGLHLGLSSIIGAGEGWKTLQTGGRLGRDAVVGRPRAGLRAGTGRLGAPNLRIG
jgi:phage tail-like protein